MLQAYWNQIGHLLDALTDPRRRERAVIGVLAGYAAIWTLYGVLAKAGQGVQIDAAEVVAWSRHLALGYTKHPPVAAWLLHLWLMVFPVADWSYYLFGLVYSSVGLWLGWQLFKYYLDADKRVVALALLTFVPVYNFFCLRFDVNAVLPPLWAATALCFIRSFETRSASWAALAGAAAAAAMLGKYWSVFLLFGLALAVLSDPRRGAYLRSGGPWITTIVGAVLLIPHLAWLVQADFAPFRYAFDERATASFLEALKATMTYLAGAAAYMVVPAVAAAMASSPSLAAIVDTVSPAGAERRFLLVSFLAPIVVPAAVALATQTSINAIWVMSGFTLLPVVLLSSPLLTITRRAAQAVLAVAVAFPLAMTAAAPSIALAIHLNNQNVPEMYGKMLADRMLVEWHKQTDLPLRLVGGDLDLAYVTAFYLADAPASLPVTEAYLAPWIDEARIKREGIVLVCHVKLDLQYGQQCIHGYVEEAMRRILADSPHVQRSEIKLTRSFMGIAGRPARFLIFVAPPWK